MIRRILHCTRSFLRRKSAELDEKNNAEVIDDTQKEDGKKEQGSDRKHPDCGYLRFESAG